MSEAQKYQGALYKEPKKGNKPPQQPPPQQQPSLQPQVHPSRQAYVESASDSSSKDNSQAMTQARNNIPPPAPSPPAATIAEAEALNVHEYLDKSQGADPTTSSKKDKKRKSQIDDGAYSYGDGPIPTTTTPTIVTARPSAALVSDKKRKRSEAPTTDERHKLLHSGLTGGLQRMLSAPEDDTTSDAQSTPLAETKRGKRQKNDIEDLSRKEEEIDSELRRLQKLKRSTEGRGIMDRKDDDTDRQRMADIEAEIERLERSKSKRKERRRIEKGEDKKMLGYHSPSNATSIKSGRSRGGGPAEGFLKLVADDRKSSAGSSRGQSVWGALKMWKDDVEEGGEEKRLWKALRMRVNERGEIVLFAKED